MMRPDNTGRSEVAYDYLITIYLQLYLSRILFIITTYVEGTGQTFCFILD